MSFLGFPEPVTTIFTKHTLDKCSICIRPKWIPIYLENV